MRCDQYIGLNDWAKLLVSPGTVKVRERVVRFYPGGRREHFYRTVRLPLAQSEVIGTIGSAFAEDFVVANLYRHTLPNGKVYEEFIQASPWSSGPCYFIALRDAQGVVVPQSLWSDQDLNNA